VNYFTDVPNIIYLSSILSPLLKFCQAENCFHHFLRVACLPLNFRHVSIFPWVTQAFHCLGSFKHACVTCSSFHVEYFLKNYFCRPRSYSRALREADVKKSNFSLGVPLIYDTYVM
jgi:hypothetical protein